MPLILVRYGEIGLKSSSVRRRFERALVENIQDQFVAAKMSCLVRQERGRVWLRVEDFGTAANVLRRVFGVVSFSEVVEASSKMEELCASAAKFAAGIVEKGESFAVKATRTGTHPYTSMDVGREAGSAIYESLKGKGVKVDLTKPDKTIHVEVRERRAYLFSSAVKGPGGLPLGTQGKVLAIVRSGDASGKSRRGLGADDGSAGRDMLAAWLLMRRGCKAVLLTENESLIEPMHQWDPRLRTAKAMGEEPNGIAGKMKCEAIVSGRDIDEIHGWKAEGALPVLYPLVGLSKTEIDRAVKDIRDGIPPNFSVKPTS